MSDLRIASRTLSILLIVGLLMLSVSCTSRHAIQPENLPAVIEKPFYVHQGYDTWYIPYAHLAEDRLVGSVGVMGEEPYHDVYGVHIYITPADTIGFTIGETSSIPLASVAKVEVYDLDIGKTVLFLIGAPIIAYFAILGLALLLKESCPFIYTWDGESYGFAGEIYSGAIHPPLERDDYLRLPGLRADAGEYRVKIANKVEEIQHTNLLELQVYDHPAGTELLVDKYGEAHLLRDLQPPLTAKAPDGQSVLHELAARDSLVYGSECTGAETLLLDGVTLTFDRPRDATRARLVLRAKNSYWLDYVYGEFARLFGDRWDDWRERMETRPVAELRQWSLEQGIPLSLYVDNGEGWEFLDYYHVAGPVEYRDDILAFDLPAGGADQVRLKLEAGRFFWLIDYAAIDYSTDLPLRPTISPLTSALDHRGDDVSRLIAVDDELYLDQPEIGDETVLVWPVPAPAAGLSRTVVLHSKGHYEILREFTGRPDREYLSTFREPGAFIRFSSERLREAYRLPGSQR